MQQWPEKTVLTLPLAQTDTKWNIRTILACKQMYVHQLPLKRDTNHFYSTSNNKDISVQKTTLFGTPGILQKYPYPEWCWQLFCLHFASSPSSRSRSKRRKRLSSRWSILTASEAAWPRPRLDIGSSLAWKIQHIIPSVKVRIKISIYGNLNTPITWLRLRVALLLVSVILDSLNFSVYNLYDKVVQQCLRNALHVSRPNYTLLCIGFRPSIETCFHVPWGYLRAYA